jgi:cytochrome c oxidase subunit 2
MRLLAGALVVAAAALAVVAFTAGGADEEAPAPRAAAVHGGQDVWVQQGCGSCHRLAAANSTGTIGPDLESTLRGRPAAYIEASIVAPQAQTTPGWGVGMMPDDYATRIAPADLDALVTFLREHAR